MYLTVSWEVWKLHLQPWQLNFSQDAPDKIYRGSAQIVHQQARYKISKGTVVDAQEHKQLDAHSANGGAKPKGMLYQYKAKATNDVALMLQRCSWCVVSKVEIVFFGPRAQ